MTKESMREALEMALDVKEKMQHWFMVEYLTILAIPTKWSKSLQCE